MDVRVGLWRSWALKNWCFWTVVLEKILESPLCSKENKPVYPKGNQSWIFIGRTDAEAETPILWLPDANNWLIGKDPNAGKDWREGEKGMTEDEMVGWHQWLNGHEFEQAPRVGDGQGSLACCSPWDCKESDTTEQLNSTQLNEDGESWWEWAWGRASGIFQYPLLDLTVFITDIIGYHLWKCTLRTCPFFCMYVIAQKWTCWV